MSDNNNRTRTFTWDDPMTIAAGAMGVSGMDFMNRMIAGQIPMPPIAKTMDYTLESVEQGRAVFAGIPAEFHYNPIGVVHGGWASTLLDSALGCAVHSMMPAGSAYTTIELHVNFVRAITVQTGKVRAIAEVLHAGRRMATAEARLVDENDKLLAHATTTCMVFEL
jgi:uncharacterized protein (TIGR00369 family)